MRKPYAIWKIGEEEYKLKLTTSAIIDLENKFKRNLVSLLEDMPPLSSMLTITHAAMQPFNHGIKQKDVEAMFDKYCDHGGSQIDFFTKVFTELYSASGFFSEAQAEAVAEKLAEAEELI